MRKAFKYRIYPTEEQKVIFAKTFGCARKIWNLMLADKIKHYKLTGKMLKNTPAQYKSQYPFLKEVDSLALANVQIALQNAYANFFDRIKRGMKGGFPRFKSRKKSRFSYSTNNQKGTVYIKNNKIRLPKVGLVKIRQHREIDPAYTIKTVTISMTPSGKYFVSVLTEYDNQVLKIIPQTFVGLDYTMHGLFVDSTGKSADYPGYYRKAERRLARRQRRFSRMKKGGSNCNKMRLRICRLYEKITNQRNDFLQKASTELVNNFDCIAVEDISVKEMAKRKKKKHFSFGKSVADNGWNRFCHMLEYKTAWQGKSFVKIDKWFPSSQLCHNCGYRNKETKDLSIREWTCPSCHHKHNRDYNAAINICNEGKRLIFANASDALNYETTAGTAGNYAQEKM